MIEKYLEREIHPFELSYPKWHWRHKEAVQNMIDTYKKGHQSELPDPVQISEWIEQISVPCPPIVHMDDVASKLNSGTRGFLPWDDKAIGRAIKEIPSLNKGGGHHEFSVVELLQFLGNPKALAVAVGAMKKANRVRNGSCEEEDELSEAA